MPSKDLETNIELAKKYIVTKGADENILEGILELAKGAMLENEIQLGLALSQWGRSGIPKIIERETGSNFKKLEEWAQANKEYVPPINLWYEYLKVEAPYLVDSFKLYIERDRMRQDRFYEPRRGTLIKISEAVQKLEDDKLDIVFLHMPPRAGKSGDSTMDVAWHCARDTEKANLYVTYKEGLGGAFLDGIKEIYTDPTYRFKDVFPDIRIVDTDAKNNKLDLNRVKKYKTLSGKGLESGLNGEYDATGWMIIDDPLEGVQDVMSPEVLKRKQTIFDNNVLSRKKEKCKLFLIGTLWSTKDLFCNYLEYLELNAQDLRWEVIKIPALDPVTDESNFQYDYGVGFSTEYYRRQRAKHEMNDDMVGWQCQYMQEPIEREGAVFNPEHMNYYESLELERPDEKPVKIIGHCDTALGGGDYVSFPVAYYYANPDGTLTGYIEDVVFDNSEKHLTEPLVVAAIKRHKMKQVHFESNQGGEAYKDDVVRMLKEDKEFKERVNISSSWAPSTKHKEQRIWDCAQEIRELYFKDPMHRDLPYRKFMQNVFSFSMTHRKRQNDDAPDSLAGLVEFNRNGSGITTAKIMKSPI